MAFLVYPAVKDNSDWHRRWGFDPPWNASHLTSMLQGGPLSQEAEMTLPRRIAIEAADYWPDFEVAGMFFVVTARAMKALQELEPHAHHYVPLAISDKTGVAPSQLFLLYCTNRIQPVIINKSEVAVRTPPPFEINGKIIARPREMSFSHNALTPKLVLDRAVVGNCHLWKGAIGGLSGHNFISSAFKARLDELRPALRCVHCEEAHAQSGDCL